MDSLDAAIFDAWNRLAPTIRADRAEALKRAARAGARTLSRPIRPWCCCIRANDTRIEQHADIADHVSRDHPHHDLFLHASALRELCTPVRIDHPGIHWSKAAAKLGYTPGSFKSLMLRSTALTIERYPGFCRGKWGEPHVWCEHRIDPSAFGGRAPDPAWGSLWLHHHENIPADAHLTVWRRPIALSRRHKAARLKRTGGPAFGGWRFVCPGIGTPDAANTGGAGAGAGAGGAMAGTSATCGRLVDRLYLPMPVWTMHHMWSEDLVKESSENAPTRWACNKCHRVRGHSFQDVNGWNGLVSYLSGGLLYGREVERPEDFPPPPRRRTHSRTKRPAPKRDEAMRLRAQGLSYKEIARRMGIRETAVAYNLCQARKAQRLGSAEPEGGRTRNTTPPPKPKVKFATLDPGPFGAEES